MKPRGEYFDFIDGLRAIAVCAVLAYHISPSLLPGGFTGVDIFFVISGYVVTASMEGRQFASLLDTLKYFYARRFVRISPALLVCVIVTSIFSAVFIPQAWLSDANQRSGILALVGLSNYYLSSIDGDYFSPKSEYNPFTHTWSLGVEEQFYLLYPFLLYASWGISKKRRPFASNTSMPFFTLALASAIACWALSHNWSSFTFYSLPTRFWELGCGVLTRQYIQHGGGKVFFTRTKWLGVLLLFFSLTYTPASSFPFPWAVLPVVGTATILAGLTSQYGGRVNSILSCMPLTWLGRRSYSLYLWHWPVLVFFRWTIGLTTIYTMLLAATISVVAAAASYAFIEQPIRNSTKIPKVAPGIIIAVAMLSLLSSGILCRFLFNAQPTITMSKAGIFSNWSPYGTVKKLSADDCDFSFRTNQLEGGDISTISPIDCRKGNAQQLVVMGDSHAGAYTAMLQWYAASSGTKVKIYTKPGCGIFDLVKSIDTQSVGCRKFVRNALTSALSELHRGDVLFLPSLRVRRIIDQWGTPPSSLALVLPDDRDRSASIAEAIPDLLQFSRAGIIVVFEGPTPMIAAPTFRCIDWYTKHNPICQLGLQVPRKFMESYRASAMKAIMEIVKSVPNSQIWDPLPKLCTQSFCSGVTLDGHPILFDADHLSKYANRALLNDYTISLSRYRQSAQ